MIRIRQNDTVLLKFAFFEDGEQVEVTDPYVDIYDPFRNLIASTPLAATIGGYYYAYYTVGSTVGTYFAVARGTYGGRTVFSPSQITFDVVSYAPLALVTLDEVKEYLSISGNDENSLLETLIYSVSRLILDYLHRPLLVEEAEEREYLSSVTKYYLSNYPVVSISTLTIDGGALTEGEDFYVDTNTGQIMFTSAQTGELYVRYTHGFQQIPEPVRVACLKVVSTLYNLRSREGYSRRQIMSYVEVPDDRAREDLLREVKPLLDPYRKAVW